MMSPPQIRESSSPRRIGRLAGLFYLTMALTAALAGYARRGLVVSGNPAQTAANIMAHQSAYLLSFAGEVLVVAQYLVVVGLLYWLLAPVERHLSYVASLVGTVACAVQGFSAVFLLVPLTLLGGEPYLSAFTPGQLQALSMGALKLYSLGYSTALPFFGIYCALIGVLVVRSTYIPRVLGILMIVTGIGWLGFLSPPFGTRYLPFIVIGSLGELALTLWLVARSVDRDDWWSLAPSTP